MEMLPLLVHNDPPSKQEQELIKIWIEKVRLGINKTAETYHNIIEEVPTRIKHNVFKQFDEYGNNLGYYIVNDQDPQKLYTFLELCPHIVWVTNRNETALHVLCQIESRGKDFIKCADLLLGNKIDVNLRDNICLSPIDWAVRMKHYDLVELLLKQKDIDIDTTFGKICWTPIKKLSVPSMTTRELIASKNIPVNNPYCSITNKFYDYFNKNEDDFINFCKEEPTIYCLNFFLEMSVFKNWKNVVKYLYFRMESNYTKYEVLLLAFEGDNIDMFMDAKSYVTYENRDLLSLLNINEGKLNKKWLKTILDLIIVNKSMLTKIGELKFIVNMEDNLVLEELLERGVPLNFTDKFGEHVFSKIGYENWLSSCVVKKKIVWDIFYINCANIVPFEDNATPEFEIINYMANSSEFANILAHPVITIVTNEKWRRIRRIFYINFMFSLLLYTTALLYIYFLYLPQYKKYQMPYKFFLVFLNLLSFFKELVQLWTSPKQYVRYFENFLDFVVIAIIFWIIFSDLATPEAKRQLSALLIVVISFEMLLLLGKFPIFSRNSAMFQAVTIEYVKFLLFFSVLLIGFSFSFHILFGSAEYTSQFFETWYLSIFKVIIMLTGELEGSNINFENGSLASYAIFIVFIFSVVIILANLLNGLAISDVEKIKNDADKLILKSRINYIYNLECILSKTWPGFLKIFPTFKIKSLIFPTSNEILLVAQECSCPNNIRGYLNYFNRGCHEDHCKFTLHQLVVPINKDAILKLQAIVNANEERLNLAERKTQQFQQESKNIKLLECIHQRLNKNDFELRNCTYSQGNFSMQNVPGAISGKRTRCRRCSL